MFYIVLFEITLFSDFQPILQTVGSVPGLIESAAV